MRLESVLAATGGRLLNDPAITRFDALALRAGKCERGTLFLAFDPTEIPEALERGAYGIVTHDPIEITDPEAAWIAVESLDEALPHLMRLWLMAHPRDFWLLDSVALAYLGQLARDPAIVPLPRGRLAMCEKILATAPDNRIFGSDEEFLRHLGLSPRRSPSRKADARLLSSTLFTTTAIVEERYFEKLPVPPCTFDAFLRALALLRELGCEADMGRLRFPPAFSPLFLDAQNREAPFGSTQRVVVLADELHGCGCLEAFGRAAWTENRIFLPTSIKLDCDIKTAINRYDSPEEVARALAPDRFKGGFVLVAGMEKERLLPHLSTLPQPVRSNKGLF
ncbi:hypothetical protein [Hydrogenimonas sp.]